MRVVLVSRAGCHLCDAALQLLRELDLEPEVADVDQDDELFRRYDWRVPVVLVDGALAAEGRITRERLEAALGRSGR